MTFTALSRSVLHTFLTISILCTLSLNPSQTRAAIEASEIELDTKNDETSRATPEEIERARTIHVSQPPPIPPQTQLEAEYFYRYRNAFTLRGGGRDIREPGPLFGFLYSFSTKSLRTFEAGADLVRDGDGILHFSIFNLSGRDRLRWFHKYGLGMRVVAKDRLTTFLRLKHWMLRAGGGFEYSLQDQLALRLDLEGLASTERLDAQGSIGLSFSW